MDEESSMKYPRVWLSIETAELWMCFGPLYMGKTYYLVDCDRKIFVEKKHFLDLGPL